MPLILFLLIPAGLAVFKFVTSAALFMQLMGYIVEYAGKLINYGTQYQNAILDPVNIPVIQVVWQILRDFVNIFFILILLVIAFATIFNISKYKAKDLLPQLIIAALLINFSLVITSEITKLFWIPASVFLTPLGPNIDGRIVNTFRMQDFFDTTKVVLNQFTGDYVKDFATIFKATATQFSLRTVMLIVDAFVLALIALIVWARIIIIMGLMMISPVAWLGYALPAIKDKSWGVWWQKLFTWGAIPIPLFALIYFTVYFNSALRQQISGAFPAAILQETFSGFGLNAGLFLVWLITMAFFLGGLMYIKTLTGGLYNWTMAGFKGTWKGIRKGVGWAVETPYEALGYKGAVGKLQKEFKEGGYPVFGRRMFGVAQRKTWEAAAEDRIRKGLGIELIPNLAIQQDNLKQSEEEIKNLETRIKASTKAEANRIITKLKESVEEKSRTGKQMDIDSETLAAISVLAKRGELEKDLFDNAAKQLEKMPLVMTKVISDWKEGKFGGLAKADDLLKIIKDTRLPLEAKRIGYGFIASDDGKRAAETMTYKDFKEGLETLGRYSKGGRDYFKFWSDSRPTYIANYRFENKEKEYKPEDQEKIKTLQDAIKAQIEKASVKDLGDYSAKEWTDKEEMNGQKIDEIFKNALTEVLKEKEDKGLARKYVVELRRKYRREGKDKQFEEIDKIMKKLGIEVKEEVVVETE